MTVLTSFDPHSKKQEQTVGRLRDALEKAESGEVIGVAMVLLEANGTSTQHYVTEWDQVRLAGALTFLLHAIASAGWGD